MQYPEKIQIFGHDISVAIHDAPLGMLPNGRHICADFHVPTNAMRIYHNDAYPSIGGTNFIHEMIEAINAHADLGLEHHKITTLASGLYQAMRSGAISWN